MPRKKRFLLPLALVTAVMLWFVMFSPWTRDAMDFWLIMSLSAVVLSTFAITGRRVWNDELRFGLSSVCLGVVIAAALWGVFWVGDKISTTLFSFSSSQIASIYSLRDGHSAVIIGLILLLVIGPVEEIFWRGYVQYEFSARYGRNAGYFITMLIYTFVHLWSFNLMLLLSAFIAGTVWGLFYRFFPRRLVAIILSHAVWDCVVFVVFPIK